MFKAATIAASCALAALPLFAEKLDVSTKEAAIKSGFVLHCAEANAATIFLSWTTRFSAMFRSRA